MTAALQLATALKSRAITAALKQSTAIRKTPRDFVMVDELWPADNLWPNYFLAQSVWVFADEYRAELTGDEDYCRIVIHAGEDRGWLYSRPIDQRPSVAAVLASIKQPVAETQLQQLGFQRWERDYI